MDYIDSDTFLDNIGKDFTYWIQLHDNKSVILKVIDDVDNIDCNNIGIDNEHTISIDTKTDSVFKDKLCYKKFAFDEKEFVKYTDKKKNRHNHITRIAVIGDTGCRFSSYKKTRCVNEDEWMFAKTLETVKKYDPELIIHLGDFIYVTSPCDDGDKEVGMCTHADYGDTPRNWRYEFFEPAKKTMPIAPWVIVRGNHEDCKRAYQGFFFFFGDENNKNDDVCKGVIKPYNIELEKVNLIVFDSSHFSSKDYKKKMPGYLKQALNLSKDGKQNWLLLHHPITIYNHNSNEMFEEQTLDSAFIANMRDKIDIMFGGHIHTSQIMHSDIFPTQIVAGNGGAELHNGYHKSHKNLPSIKDKIISIIKHKQSYRKSKNGEPDIHKYHAEHGFTLMEYMDAEDMWSIKSMSHDDKIQSSCVLHKDNGMQCDSD